MTPDRARGAVLYAGAAVLLAAGGFWWMRAAPHVPPAPDFGQWRATAERVLPSPDDAEADDTVELGSGASQEISASIPDGTHHVELVCVGGPGSLVRVSLGQYNDTGRPVNCGDRPTATGFDVGLAGDLKMNVEVDSSSPVIFRYAVTRVFD